MFKLVSCVLATATLTFALSACSQGSYATNESSKLLGTIINGAIDPTVNKTQLADLTKQCAALQARISACNTLGANAPACIENVKAQSPVASKCML